MLVWTWSLRYAVIHAGMALEKRMLRAWRAYLGVCAAEREAAERERQRQAEEEERLYVQPLNRECSPCPLPV
jgi:hypothetical protein